MITRTHMDSQPAASGCVRKKENTIILSVLPYREQNSKEKLLVAQKILSSVKHSTMFYPMQASVIISAGSKHCRWIIRLQRISPLCRSCSRCPMLPILYTSVKEILIWNRNTLTSFVATWIYWAHTGTGIFFFSSRHSKRRTRSSIMIRWISTQASGK